MNCPDQLARLANALRSAEATGQPIGPIRDQLTGPADAYHVQKINIDHRVAAGGRIVGRKIGLTNPNVQAQLGVDQPDYGTLMADMDIPHGHDIPWSPAAQMRVEAEIAFILGRDLPHADTTSAEVLRAVDCALPALEIVGSRIANWDIAFVDTVADNGSSAFFTLGPSPRRIADIDMLDGKMALEADNHIVSQGAGRACLGSPLNAVRWLARIMATNGTPLAAGDVILSGALGPMVDAAPGTTYTAMIDGFGETCIRFGAAS